MLIDDPDPERWAEALAIERRYGKEAAIWIADQIRTLDRAGDQEGVERFQQIASRLDVISLETLRLRS